MVSFTLHREKMQQTVCSRFVVTTVVLVLVSPLRSGLLLAAASDAMLTEGTEPKDARDDCDRLCGNVSVPWPFGFEDRCAWKKDMVLSCNYTASPPQLILGINVPVFSIFVEDSTMIISLRNAYDCYLINGGKSYRSDPERSIRLSSSYTFSSTRNKFTVLGCDTTALLSDALNTFGSGCSTFCKRQVNFSVEPACTGLGCCQTSIPRGMRMITVNISSVDNHRSVWEFNPCGTAFLADKGTFDMSVFELPNFSVVGRTSKLVLDWVGGQSEDECKQAMSDLTKSPPTYACGPKTTCTYYDDAEGYRCYCKAGYAGNPYDRIHGCQDINECSDRQKYPCHGTCRNRPGYYDCHCPFGMIGDGKKACDISRLTIIAAVILTTLFCITLGALLWVLWKRRTREKNFERNGGYLLKTLKVKIFTEAQIKKATNDFSDMIGEGILCSVYKGTMPDADVTNPLAIKKHKDGVDHESQTISKNSHSRGVPVAIKRAKDEITDKKKVRDVHASSVNREFQDEIKIILQINHKNVVKLLGVCLETKVPILVFEYVSKGSLHDHIHRKVNSDVLSSWKNRLRIAFEMASALQYLHSVADPPVMHGDIKPKNILLDDTDTVKISDFRASSLILPEETTGAVEGVKGDLAYLDPEYLQTKTLTVKSDVYSFGVILVELLTGLPADNKENRVIQPFKSAVQKKTLSHIISIMENVDGHEKEEIVFVAEIAYDCLNDSASRPEMKDVVEKLSSIKKNS